MNIAEALERDRWPLYCLDVGSVMLETVRLRPGLLLSRTVAVRPGMSAPAWETARRLVEDDA